MEIPETRREEDALREHDEQKARHEETIEEHKRHPEDGVAYHHMKEDKRVMDEEIGFHEKGDRRQEDMDTAALTEEANTILREQ